MNRWKSLVVIGAAMFAAACGGDSGGTTGTGGGGGGGGGGGSTSNQITVNDNNFTPSSTTLAAGATVTWTWAAGATDHNVTFPSGTSSGTQSSGTFARTFPSAGDFSYSCTLHSGMNGVIHIQ